MNNIAYKTTAWTRNSGIVKKKKKEKKSTFMPFVITRYYMIIEYKSGTSFSKGNIWKNKQNLLGIKNNIFFVYICISSKVSKNIIFYYFFIYLFFISRIVTVRTNNNDKREYSKKIK